MTELSSKDYKNVKYLRGAWLAQSVEHATLDLRVMSSSLMFGTVLT